MVIPLIIKLVINEITNQTLSISQLLFYFFLAILSTTISAVFNIISRYFTSSMGTTAQYLIRKDLYNNINNQSFRFFDNSDTGDLVARITSDINNTNSIFNRSVNNFISSIITLIVVPIACFITIKTSIIIILISLIAYYSIILFSYKKLSPVYLSSRNNFGKMTTIIRENLLGAVVVRIFNGKKKEIKKFEKKNNAFKNDTIKSIKWQSIIFYSGTIIGNLLIIFSLIYGGYLTINNNITIGILISFISYMTMLIIPFKRLGNIIINFVQAEASLKRIDEILETKTEIKEKKNAIKRIIKGDIEFKNVYFSYLKDSIILNNINFKIKKGQKIVIVGTTGSGKSTLIKLIPRYYEINKGKILIDNINIKNYNIKNLRNQIGVCSQEIFLFKISIADNIRFGRNNASMDEVITAAKHANIHDFIMTLPKGYDTIISERGNSLSGGQKQRVSIARALILKPKILILDNSTSALDTETEHKIQKGLNYLMKSRTSFIITQRVNNFKTADKIIVMDKGKVIGFNSHKKLYRKNEIYSNIYDTLFKKQKEAEFELKTRGEK